MIGGFGQRSSPESPRGPPVSFFSSVDDVLRGKRPLVEAVSRTASAD
jgi:hypothetical protein